MGTIKFYCMCILFSFIAAQSKAQPWFGQEHFTHDSTNLCSAIITNISPGYAMAGFRQQRWTNAAPANRFDFVIDKVNAAGTFVGANNFSRGYKILSGPNCTSALNTFRCSGVTIIESPNLALNAKYAVAGTCNRGIFFLSLNALGGIVRRNFWPFPLAGISNLRKAVIRESVFTPGEYYICGNYGSTGFVMKVDAFGTQIWGNQYGNPEYIEPRDLIESPYTAPPNAELIVVGRTDRALSAADGMVMSLSAATGAVNYVQNYTIPGWDSDDWFSCIELANSPNGAPGFVLGGRVYGRTGPPSSPMNPEYSQWMCKIDQFGGVLWSSLIQPAAVPAGGFAGDEISRVYERFNTTSSPSSYEYYGVAGNNYYINAGGIVPQRNLNVYKLDDNGLNTLLPNEFHYTKGEAPNGYAALTGIETSGGANDGIQAFGSLQGSNIHYFVKSYFNGYSGCNEDIESINTIYGGPQLDMSFTTSFIALTPCTTGVNFNITSVALTPFQLCYASSLPLPASNARIAVGINEETAELDLEGVSVYPNPIVTNATIAFSSALSQPATVSVYNTLGQKVKDYRLNANESEMTLDFDALHIESGIYIIQVATGDKKNTYKVIYQQR